MSRTLMIGALVYLMVQAVFFGLGLLAILLTPLASAAMELMPWMVLVTFLLAVPVSWVVAGRLRARHEIRVPAPGV
jgi:branched-subunit amino acid ABC-type transport system permease component